MKKLKESLHIVLDADGVMVDFNTAYLNMWEKVFGYRPRTKYEGAYWCTDAYDIPWLSGEELFEFKKHWNEDFWMNIPALPGAVEAVKMIQSNFPGVAISCVSALPVQYRLAREIGLEKQGFPFMPVHAVGAPVDATKHHGNPKKDIINKLMPDYFVDDFLPYLEGVNPLVNRILVDRDPFMSPNRDQDLQEKISITARVDNLVDFAEKLVNGKL